jgi:outer membrane protein assembly factor BamD
MLQTELQWTNQACIMQMTPPPVASPSRTKMVRAAFGVPLGTLLRSLSLPSLTLGMTPLLVAPLLLSGLFLSGCSSTDSPDPEPAAEELKDNSKPAIDTPEAQLLADSMRYFQAGLYTVAIDSFEKLRDGYPLGPYAELADIKVADSHFESSNFTAAAGFYEEFLKSRPDSQAVPYVLLRAARSNQLANRGIGRDAASLQKAAEFYDQLLNRFPSSPYAEGAAVYRQQTRDLMAANEKVIVDFYKKRDKHMAYEARKKEFASRFGKPSDEFELSEEIVPVAEKLPPAPQGTRVLVETNLAGSDATLPRTPLLAPQANARQASKAPASGLFVRFLECNKTQRLVLLHLSTALNARGSIETQSPIVRGPLGSNAQGLALRVAGLKTLENAPLEKDCFGTRDLTVLPSGEVRLTTEADQAEVMELTNPPRILIALR